MRKLNIGVILDNEFDDDHRVRREVNILKKAGHNIHILCFSHQNEPHLEMKGVKVERIKMSRKLKNLLYFFTNRIPAYEYVWKKAIRNFILQNRIEVLHVHDLYMSRAGYQGVSASNKNVKMILDLHENYPETVQTYNWTKGLLRNFISNPKAWKKKESEYLSYASAIIVLSDSYKEKLIKNFEFLRNIPISAFPNVIDFNQFASFKINPKLKKSDTISLMYFGVVAERRGVFDAIEVLKRGRKEGLNISLLLIGPADKADLPRLNEALQDSLIENYIQHIPWIDLSELLSYMNVSDILLSPIWKNDQHESGVANKIFQYMYGGKPIVVSDCGPQKKLIEDFNCGLAYKTQEEFYDCVEKLAHNEDLRRKMGTNGYDSLHEHFDTDLYESKLVDLYKSIAE